MKIYKIKNSSGVFIGKTADSQESVLYLNRCPGSTVEVEEDPNEDGSSRLPSMAENVSPPPGESLTQ